MSLGKSDPPPAPDYAAAARTQGGANLQSTIASSILNNPDQVTPYGTQRRTQTGTYTVPGAEGNAAVDIPTFTSQVDFTPEGQARWAQEQRIIGNLGNVAEQGLGRVGQTFATPFSFGGANDAQAAAEKAIFSRLNPQMDVARRAREQELANQGIGMGSSAYDDSMRQLGLQENDARQQAVLAGFNVRPQMIQEESFLRNLPLNELNALRSGSQVQAPTFQSPGNLNVAPPNLAGAAQAQYGAQMGGYSAEQAQQAGVMNGIFGLGSAALMGGFNPFGFGGAATGAGSVPGFSLKLPQF